MVAYDYVDKVLPLIEKFYGLSKYFSKQYLSRDYQLDLDTPNFLNEEVMVLYQS